MKKFKNLVIGGIETKIFNLILITVIILSLAFLGVNLYQGNMLNALTAETSAKQQETTSGIISETMSTVTRKSMERTTDMEAQIVDGMFQGIRSQVLMAADYARKIFADPESFPAREYAGPDASHNGELVAQVIYADGVDPEDPAIIARTSLAANLSDLMISLCEATESDNIYLGMPEGIFLSINRTSTDWFGEDGKVISYDPRTRFWYKQAVEAGGVVFSDLEVDATTGEMSVVCAVPVYGPDGQVAGVVGTDLFLHAMEAAVQGLTADGGYSWIVNREGHVIYSPNKDVMKLSESASAQDLRQSENAELAALVRDAMDGRTGVQMVSVKDVPFYMTGTPVNTVGWTLFSAFPKDAVDQVESTLLASYAQITEEAKATYQAKSTQAKHSSWILAGVLALLLGAATLVLGKRIVKPLNRITNRIAELKEGDLEFKMEDAYRTGDEIEVLAESFANLSHKTLEYVEQVKTATAAKERISTELTMANRIQESMLPHVFPPYPDRKEFDIYATMDPAREVGGDFYDFYLLDDDHLCVVMADVSGKGVPAALFMMISKTILQSCAMLGQSAGAILAKTNEALCSNNQVEMFVTVWLGILEISTGKMTCANAGHEYPAVYSEGGSHAFELLKDKHGFVVGGMEGVRYKEYEFRMKPGDKLFVYTDGVPEATNAQLEMFGTERMINVLNGLTGATPKEVLTTVKKEVDAFVGEAEQFDDMTMLCLQYRGPEAAGSGQ